MADPICRWRNATPKTICEIVETLPKNEMSESEFRLIMNQSKWKESFFRTVYQFALQILYPYRLMHQLLPLYSFLSPFINCFYMLLFTTI